MAAFSGRFLFGGRFAMNLSAPTDLVCLLSVLLIVVAVSATFLAVPVASTYAFELAVLAYLVLLAGNLVEGL